MNNASSRKECPRCGAELKGGEDKCPSCGRPMILGTAAGQAVGPVEKPVNCPVCKLPVYKAKIAGREMLHCAECEGSAYPRDTLMKLQALEKKVIDISAEERDYRRPPFFEKRDKPPFLICPFCGKKMAEKRLGQMQADMCTECKALWLDAGKEKHINDILGAYKMSIMNASGNSGGRRERR
jgi:Zn-finger nucleic acid-binding protein